MKLVVRAGPIGCGAAAIVAIEGEVHLQRHGLEASRVHGVEDVVRIERPVVVADPGVIAANDQVGTAEILPKQSVQQRFARTCVAHFDRTTSLNDGARHEIILDQRIDCPGPDVGRNVARLELAENLMDEQPVTDLDGDLGQILVAAMHGVAGLEGRHFRPSPRLEPGAGFGRAEIQARERLWVNAFAQRPHGARQVDLALGHHLGDTRVGQIRASKDVRALQLPVDRVLFRDRHHGHNLAQFLVEQRHVLVGPDAVGQVLATGQGDRNGPEHAVYQPHVQADPAPVVVPHEAVERCIGAHRHHHEIGALAAGHRHGCQSLRSL